MAVVERPKAAQAAGDGDTKRIPVVSVAVVDTTATRHMGVNRVALALAAESETAATPVQEVR